MAALTANEQFMLELVNRARMDPTAEAKRLGIDLNQGLASGTISAATKAPLAANALLTDSALAHSRWMLNTDTFSHTGNNGSTPTDRMLDAGYALSGSWRTGENISFTGTTGTIDLTAAIASQHEGLFLSAGHRANILGADFREIGIGQAAGVFTQSGTNYNASMVTQDFAKTGTAIFLTGVVYNDTSGDDFYSVGEGKGGVAVAVGSTATTTQAAGGYRIAASTGTRDVSLDGVKLKATILSENAKIDLVDGHSIESSVSLQLVSGATSAKLLGLNALSLKGAAEAEVLYGNAAGNAISGGNGSDRLYGLTGNDRLSGDGGNDVLTGGAGGDRLTGGEGTDTASYAGASKGVTASLADISRNTNDAKGDIYASIEGLTGSSHADGLYGNGRANTLSGGSGDDILSSGSGNDRLYGALGADDLVGGSGADTFLFRALSDSTVTVAGRDTIFDFSGSGGDRIDLSAIDADSAASGNQAFDYIGTAVFSGEAGELRSIKSTSDTYIYGDVNGDRKVDLAIHLDDAVTLSKGYFIV